MPCELAPQSETDLPSNGGADFAVLAHERFHWARRPDAFGSFMEIFIMLRFVLSSIGLLAIVAAGAASAADTQSSSKSESQKNKHFEAQVSKVDSQTDKLEVKITGKDGKQTEKSLELGKNVEIRDADGKKAKLEDLKAGTDIRITEDKDGKVSKIHEENVATITNVDEKNGIVTVQMRDKNGQQASRTFHLTEDAEYIDSNGDVAKLDVFRSGDLALFVLEEGKITGLSKTAKPAGSMANRSEEQQSGQRQ
jgi:hypothetical protein